MIFGENGTRREPTFDWDKHPNAVELVRNGWKAGDSCSTIANTISQAFHVKLTRNAIIGKIHRLGLRHAAPAKEPNQNHPGIKRKYTRAPWANGVPVYSGGPRLKRIATDLNPETSANPVGIYEIKETQCHWPVNGSGYQIMFCGDPAEPHLPYCTHHCCVAYRSVAQMRAEAKVHSDRHGRMPFIVRSSHIT